MLNYNRYAALYLFAVGCMIKAYSRRSKIEDEISDHIECIAEELIADGYHEKKAVLLALRRMGSPFKLGRHFKKAYKPVDSKTDIIGRNITQQSFYIISYYRAISEYYM
jgi:hypothetical protein